MSPRMPRTNRFWTWAKPRRAFFAGKARRPKFKSKKRSKPSFYLANDQFELGDHRLWVPKLGWVNMAEKLRFRGKVIGARITKTAEWWFVSIQVELPDAISVKRPAAVGIDVGLNRLATLSTGEGVENQALLKAALKKLRQAGHSLASPQTMIKKPGEGTQAGCTPALPY